MKELGMKGNASEDGEEEDMAELYRQMQKQGSIFQAFYLSMYYRVIG